MAAKTIPASKFSKADLETQVVKLERALTRSRKQVAELKQLVSEAGARADRAETAEKTGQTEAVTAKKKPTPAPTRRKKAVPVQQVDDEEPVLDEASGEAETEAHAS